MIDHLDFAVSNLARSREFYVLALAPLGITALLDVKRDNGSEGTGFGSSGVPKFWIGKGQPTSGRLHIAFRAGSNEMVNAFHHAAVEAGGTDNGKPAMRPKYGEFYYAAFVLDPDGHNIEAVCRTEDLCHA